MSLITVLTLFILLVKIDDFNAGKISHLFLEQTFHVLSLVNGGFHVLLSLLRIYLLALWNYLSKLLKPSRIFIQH